MKVLTPDINRATAYAERKLAYSKRSDKINSSILSDRVILIIMITYILANDRPQGIRAVAEDWDISKSELSRILNSNAYHMNIKLARMMYIRMYYNSKQFYDANIPNLTPANRLELEIALTKLYKMSDDHFTAIYSTKRNISQLLWGNK